MNYRTVLIMWAAVVWILILVVSLPYHRFYSYEERVFTVILSVFVAIILAIECVFYRRKKWRLLLIGILFALNLLLTKTILFHPYYSVADYLLYLADEEEKSAYYELGDCGAAITMDKGHVAGISFENSHINSAQLKLIEKCPKLKSLNLQGSNLSEPLMSHLQRLNDIVYLNMSGSNISDNELEHMRTLGSLQILKLDDTVVSDNGLKSLVNLKQLRILQVNNTKVTAKGIKEMKSVLPACSVRHNSTIPD